MRLIMLNGQPHCLTVLQDITERKRIEEELQRAQKLESLGVLAGGIAHDFNNLLAGIFGYIDLARNVSKDGQAKEYLETTLATMNRAKALTLQLLTFAKGGSPVQKITPLVPFLQDTAQFALSGSNISSKFHLDDNLWSCNIDKNQIGQVIDNLVINAQQAMPGGGTIEISARNQTLGEKERPSLPKGDYVKVSVKDSGIGIPKEILPGIFDPFFTTKTKGHGLGLATCYSIVKRHGGCIDVESEPGKGSTFHVYLPATQETVVVNAPNPIKHRGSGVILVMDDEEVVRNTVRTMLESLGYVVVCKQDGKEAVDFFEGETKGGRRFAAMIFDLTVPGAMGGIEALKEIRKSNTEIPVFVSSGYANNSVMKTPKDFGFTGSISKPFTIIELSEMLDAGLSPHPFTY
jgi:nitrogen-specific signal transduction histidine kinase/CheY-like chemotaxis protein